MIMPINRNERFSKLVHNMLDEEISYDKVNSSLAGLCDPEKWIRNESVRYDSETKEEMIRVITIQCLVHGHECICTIPTYKCDSKEIESIVDETRVSLLAEMATKCISDTVKENIDLNKPADE